MKLKLPIDLKEFIRLLNAHQVEYLLIGGWAVGLHGQPRYTKDIDFFIRPNLDNAKRLMEVIVAFGFGSLQLSQEDFIKEDSVVMLGKEPNRIDLIAAIQGISFDLAWQSRELVELDGEPVNLIGAECLIQNKTAVGRPQDLADVATLRKIKALK